VSALGKRVTVGWQHNDEDFRVALDVTPGSKGVPPSMAGPGEPAEGPELEVVSVREDAPGGAERPDLVEAAERDIARLEDAAVTELEDDEPDYDRDDADEVRS